MSSPIPSSFLLSDNIVSSSTMLGIISPSIIVNPAAVSARSSTFIITSAMLSEHTLQAQVELEYVRVGTEVMNSALTSLDTAITITQNALNQLTTLQNLHNQISITASSPFTDLLNFTDTSNQTVTITSYNTTISAGTTITTNTTTYSKLVNSQGSFVSAYYLLASTYYGKPIAPVFHVSIPAQLSATAFTPAHAAFSTNITSATQSAYLVFVDMLKSTQHSISATISGLSAITKPGDEETLLTQLKAVRADLPSLTSFSAVKQWALDNYGGSTASAISKQGVFQQDITNAITGAESLNTSQQQSVRQYMFVFEQYCQSAAAILTALDQIFDKISRNIAS